MIAVDASASKEDVLLRAYTEADHEQRIRLSRIGCFLALFLVPLFWGLDWISYPDHVLSFGVSRLLCVCGVGIILILLATTKGRLWIRTLGIAWAFLPGVAISWMIYASDGAKSPYYAGLNLVMIIVSLLMPWTAIEVVILCALTIGMYVAACFLHASTSQSSMPWVDLVNNLYFMISTALICIIAGFFSGRRRFEEFRLRYELNQKNQQLAEMDKIKSEFYGNVSHELRTPLTLIIAPLTRLIEKGGFTREVTGSLVMMRNNAMRLLRLINDLLEVVRMDGGHLVIRRSRVNLSTWIPGIVSSMSYLADSKHIMISTKPPSDDIITEVDVGMMEKVLLNLLSNAIKFTPENGRITVTWGSNLHNDWISVSDTGIGIADNELPKLFSRFHQADASTTRRYRGLGIGLALSRDLIERHAGRLTATSVLGKGSTFTVELQKTHTAPNQKVDSNIAGKDHGEDKNNVLKAPEDPEKADFIVQAYREADRIGHTVDTVSDFADLGQILESEQSNASTELVLVADDEPDMRRFLISLLRERYRVIATADGESAVKAALQYHPSLAILDMTMPNLNGIQTCQALRRHESTCECRIILLTARADDETKLSALQGGVDDFLSKPFNSEEILSRVHNLLENAAMQRHLRDRNRDLEEAMSRLRQAEAQLVQSEKMNAIGSLASGLLHEINNPLNYSQIAVHLALERLGKGKTDLAEMLKDAQDGMTRIGAVITSLRAFAYPERVDLNEPFAISESIDLALRFTSHLCDERTIIRQVEPDLYSCGSVNQMSMVLVNLVSNAAKATPPGGEIRISARKENGQLIIEISDTGVGMDEERIRRAFDPFYTSDEPGQGMGLGLTICHTIVRNHRGHINILSKPNAGTTIKITLPIPAAIQSMETVYGN